MDDLLAEIDPARVWAEINAQTIAEAWVRVFRRRQPGQWPSVSQVVDGVRATGRTCGRGTAETAIEIEKINDANKLTLQR